MATYTYPEDRIGNKASNLVTNEEHVLTPDNSRNFQFIIPNFAPFYGTSVKLFKSINSTLLPLVLGTDYHFSLEYVSASLSTGKPVYGGISFVDLSIDGTILIQEYRTVGGAWTLDTQEMLESIANIIFNPRKLTWDQIVNKPAAFGPTEHTFNFNNLLTEKQIGDKLTDIRNAVLEAAQSDTDHESRMDNPHNTTAAQLGVGAFFDKGIATIDEAIDGEDPDKVITASTLKSVLISLGLLDVSLTVKEFNDHLDRRDNPHVINKQQLEVDLVENLEVANLSDILSKRKVRKYVTLENMIDFNRIHGCATSDADTRKFPVKDSLLSSYCKVRDNMGIYADGYGGTYERIIENNSSSCGYLPPPSSPQHPPKGTILTRYCVGTEQHGLYADGYGGTYSNFIAMNSPACGYTGDNGGTTHPPAGTVLGQYCDGTTQVQTKANGSGGSYEDRVPNSSACSSNVVHPPAGTLMSTYCDGFNQMGRYANGQGGTYNAVVQANSTQCGWTSPTPAPTPPPVTQPPATPPPLTPPPPVTQPPAQKSITGTFDKSSYNVGDTETFTITLRGYPANSVINVKYFFVHPNYNGGQPFSSSNVDISTDSTGYGRNTIVRVVDILRWDALGIDRSVSTYQLTSYVQAENLNSANVYTTYKKPNIRLTITSNKSFVRVGETYRLTVSMTGAAAYNGYTIRYMQRDPARTDPESAVMIQARPVTSNSSGTGADYLDVYSDGFTATNGKLNVYAELFDSSGNAKSNELLILASA